ncbi:hypothetical protein BJ138DRAFT_1016773 [Hygrophoropsis aurantiaca]|uniref:Uncharacterized protein n=1 Tax=Hygrophoropsis aurantiaca TaxID=72124 RepID=A0ACB7ZY94_9AGAM|nr:hypothetical protein BJ138DRAFT_1016773 [Hygrophoropsis aurantiaca]
MDVDDGPKQTRLGTRRTDKSKGKQKDTTSIPPSRAKSNVKAKTTAKTLAKGKGKQKAAPEDEAQSGGSDFAADALPSESDDDLPATKRKTPAKRKAVTTQTTSKAMPTPSMHHRHRAVPLFHRAAPVERLVARPSPISSAPTHTAPTHAMTSRTSGVTARVGKAWGYSVGAGPVWELLEDRGWFGESEAAADAGGENEDGWREEHRRPRVYASVRVGTCTVLQASDATRYLPAAASAADPVPVPTAATDPGIRLSLGPVMRQTRIELGPLEGVAVGERGSFFRGFMAHIFNAGAPVWGLDWCPVHPRDRVAKNQKQYLAVAPFPVPSSGPPIGAKAPRPKPGCIQIWSLSRGVGNTGISGGKKRSKPTTTKYQTEAGAGKIQPPTWMSCELVLCLDGGAAHELKWCPLPAGDEIGNASEPDPRGNAPEPSTRGCACELGAGPRKLGILAGTFEDGSVSVYVVPDPDDVRARDPGTEKDHGAHLPHPHLRLELQDTACWCLDWADSEVLGVGCTNGACYIAVYNIGEALRSADGRGEGAGILPTHYIAVHQSALRALAWIRVPRTSRVGGDHDDGRRMHLDHPTVIASGGYDGVECLTDIREPHGNVMNRTRDIIPSVAYSAFAAGPIMIDNENAVKAYAVSPSMLGRGHVLLEPGGPVWSVDASDYHPQLAVGSADGTCITTNMLRSTRRGGAVPFFVHKIYQLDYSRKSGEYRMLERFLPQETQDKSSNPKTRKSTPAAPTTGVHPAEQSVQRVTWNSGNGLAHAPLLASATGAGLVRVDWLVGRFFKGKVPYVSVEGMRCEDGEGDDEEGDSGEE